MFEPPASPISPRRFEFGNCREDQKQKTTLLKACLTTLHNIVKRTNVGCLITNSIYTDELGGQTNSFSKLVSSPPSRCSLLYTHQQALTDVSRIFKSSVIRPLGGITLRKAVHISVLLEKFGHARKVRNEVQNKTGSWYTLYEGMLLHRDDSLAVQRKYTQLLIILQV